VTAWGESRDFWLLWGSVVSSNLGDGIRQTALPLYAVTLTNDPLAISAVSAASFMPWLLSMIGGAVVDRADRRKLVIGGQLVRGIAVAVFGVLVLTGQAGLAMVYLVALVIGGGEVVVDSALQAAIPRVAGEDLDTANSRVASGQLVAGEILGGPLGGALFTISASLPFLLDAATFAIGAWLVVMIVQPLQESTEEEEADQTSIRQDIGEGLRFLKGQPILRGMTVAVTLSNLADAAFTALLVLLVTNVVGGSEFSYGVLVAVGAVGGLAGALVSARFVALFGRRVALIAPFVVMTIGLVLAGLVTNIVVVGLAMFVVLFSIALYNVSGQSIRQRVTPDRLLGRVVASMRFFAMGAVPVGALGGGLVARYIGVQETILLTAAINLCALLAIVIATAGQDLDEDVRFDPTVDDRVD
jgi:MFS family permease